MKVSKNAQKECTVVGGDWAKKKDSVSLFGIQNRAGESQKCKSFIVFGGRQPLYSKYRTHKSWIVYGAVKVSCGVIEVMS